MFRPNIGAVNVRGLHVSGPKIVSQLATRFLAIIAAAFLFNTSSATAQSGGYQFNDSHFHLTNYIQEGTNIHDFLNIMGARVGRVALFGIPLQQQWSYRVDADNGPTYYLNSDAQLYYYSFTVVLIALAYKSKVL